IQRRVSCPTFNSGSGVVGIQNNTATVAYTPPGRNTGTWSTATFEQVEEEIIETNIPEAWRFSPSGPSIVDFACYHNGAVISTDLSIDVSVTESTVYVAEPVYHSCSGDIIKCFTVYIDVVPQTSAGEPQDIVQCNSNIFDLTQVYDDILSTLGPTENVELSL